MNHYLTYPTATEFACGAIALGRRNTARDTDTTNTTCPECRATPAFRERVTYAGEFQPWQWPDVPARRAEQAGA